MSNKCQFEVQIHEQAVDIHISGVIDEDLDFSQHPIDSYTMVRLHLKNIRSINSCGIREWIRWMQGSPDSEIQLLECPKVIVDQINMVQGFLPKNGKVMSFYVPYFSDGTGEERLVCLTRDVHYNQGELHLPQDIVDSEGQPMEMDVVEEKYFRFLTRRSA